MVLVVGLGNPGARYAATRHNLGFMAVDAFAASSGAVAWREKFAGLVATCRLGSQPITLLKPQTFMNLSGRSVQAAASFLQVPSSAIVVVHDELDLPFGRLRVKLGGGHGGHNGLRSLIDCLASGDFLRLRLGVGRPAASFRGDVAAYLLTPFDESETIKTGVLCTAAAHAIESIVSDGAVRAMNVVNQKKD